MAIKIASKQNPYLPYARHYNPRFVYLYPIFHCGLYCRAVNISGFFFHLTFYKVAIQVATKNSSIAVYSTSLLLSAVYTAERFVLQKNFSEPQNL